MTYDAETGAPAESAAGRAEAVEVLSRAQFDLLTAPSVDQLLDDARPPPRPSRSMPRCGSCAGRCPASAPIPADEYAAFERLVQESVAAWAKAKKASDFSLFAPYLERLWRAAAARPARLPPTGTPTRPC